MQNSEQQSQSEPRQLMRLRECLSCGKILAKGRRQYCDEQCKRREQNTRYYHKHKEQGDGEKD